MTRRVVVTGMGAISGLGNGFETNWRRALNCESATREIESDMGSIADGTGMTGVAAWIEEAVVEAAMPGWRMDPGVPTGRPSSPGVAATAIPRWIWRLSDPG